LFHINLNIRDYTLPKSGVYIQTLIDNIWLDSLTFLGHRETTDGDFAVETHILNRDIYKLEEHIEIDIEFYSFSQGIIENLIL